MTQGNQSLKPVRFIRARGYRLYDANGRRYLDFWQEGGRAILGHRPAGVSLEMKNAIEKGLLGSLPSIYEERLVKAMRTLLPGYDVIGLFGSRESLVGRLVSLTGRFSGAVEIGDPALTPESREGTHASLWRPFMKRETWPDLLVPVIPFPVGEAPWILCGRAGKFEAAREGGWPFTGTTSPILLAGACRAVYDLLGAKREDPSEEEWGFLPRFGFRRKGVYLTFDGDRESHSVMVHAMMERGFRMCPVYPSVDIIPGEYSPGELKLFRKGLEDVS